MWPSSPANRPRLGTALVLFLLLTAAVPVPEDDGAHYRRCLDAARAEPAKGLAIAQDWRNANGGFPAAHCAAVALFELKRYAEAAQNFEALGGAMMQRSPELRAGALQQAGQAWLLAGKPEAARAAFDAALRFTPRDPELLIDRARADGAAEAYRDAVADLDAALAIEPKRAEALVYRASAYRQLGLSGPRPRRRAPGARARARPCRGPSRTRQHPPPRRRQRGRARGLANRRRLAPDSPAAKAAGDNLARLAATTK